MKQLCVGRQRNWAHVRPVIVFKGKKFLVSVNRKVFKAVPVLAATPKLLLDLEEWPSE